MIEVSFHGRGGQGAVTAARLLAEAAFMEGKYCQAFPFFGAERRGAPVVAFTRINDKPIRVRSEVYAPDYVVIFDPTILETVDITSGLKPDSLIVINSKNVPERLRGRRVALVDASKIAMDTLGRPIVNTAMLGAFARASGLVSWGAVAKSVEKYFKGKGAEKNVAAVMNAYEQTVVT